MKTKLIILLAMLAAAGLAGAQMFAQLFGGETWTPAALNPVAWYKAEDNAIDSIGAYNGMWGGTAAYSTGKIGNSFAFNGSKSIGTSAKMTTSFSMSCWVNRDSTKKEYRAMWASGPLSTWLGFSPTGEIRLHMGGVDKYKDTAANVIPVSTWTLVCVTWNGSSAILYVDGEVVSWSSGRGTLVSPPSENIVIGKYAAGAMNYMLGSIDDFLFFNRVLTHTEIKKLYDESVLKNGAAW